MSDKNGKLKKLQTYFIIHYKLYSLIRIPLLKSIMVDFIAAIRLIRIELEIRFRIFISLKSLLLCT